METTGARESLVEGAADQLLTQGFPPSSDFSATEAQVRALGGLAGLAHAVVIKLLGCLALNGFEDLESAWLGCWLEPANPRIDALAAAAGCSLERRPQARASGVLHQGRPRGRSRSAARSGAGATPEGGAGGLVSNNGEFLQALRDLVSTSKEATDGRLAAERALARTAASGDRDGGAATDHVNAITRLEFKQHLLVLKDSDPDIDRHIKHIQSILDCHAFGRKGVQPVGLLNLLRNTPAVGGARLKVYDTYLRKAWNDGLMSHDARAVYEGVLAKLRSAVGETAMQRHRRVEKAFDNVSMGHMCLSTFGAEWDKLLVEMQDGRLDPLSENMLFRRYLCKISPDLQHAVLSRASVLGPSGPPRHPCACEEEVALRIDMELDMRIDAREPKGRPTLPWGRAPERLKCAVTANPAATARSFALRKPPTSGGRARSP